MRGVGAGALAVLLSAALFSSGCVSFVRTRQGTAPDAPALQALQSQATLAEVLQACGTPTETWLAPDGLILVYREQQYAFDRLGLSVSQILTFVDVSQVAATVLSNLRLILERGRMSERRLVVQLDGDDRLVAFAYSDFEGHQP